MSGREVVRVGWLYPEHLNIYADRGNLLLLGRRCEWRGLGLEVTPLAHGDAVDPEAFDLLYLGVGRIATRRAARPTSWNTSGTRSTRPRLAVPSCSGSVAATSCWATSMSLATSGCPGLGLWICARCAVRVD